MPLFEWHISEIITNTPNEVRFNPSPWITKFGESLENGLYISRQIDGQFCKNNPDSEKLNPLVRRSWSEETLERITRSINHNIIP